MHHPHIIFLLLICTLGQILRIMLKAGGSKQSKLSGVKSMRQYVEINSKFIAGRFVFASFLLWIWIMNPGMVEKLINGIPLVTKYVGYINYPLNALTAAIWGYMADSLLDKLALVFPFLQKDIPPEPAEDVTDKAA
jgi:hypothetical protein